MRPALAAVSPLLDEIMADLDLGAAGGGLITTTMVVCMGVASPAAPLLVHRWGLDRTLLAGLAVLAAGIVLRSADGPLTLYAGAVVTGSAIAVLNVIMPAVVKHHFPRRLALMTGVYVTALVFGAAGGSASAVPLEHAVGHGWRPAAALGVVPAVAALALWAPQARRPALTSAGARPRYPGLLRDPLTWYVTGFMGLQSMTFYIMLAWLPTIFHDAGLPAARAGYLLGLSSLVQVVTTLTAPVYAGRGRSQSGYVVAAAGLTIAGYVGVLAAPATLSWLWMVVLGLGQGGSLALALLIIALRAPDPQAVTALSAVAQSCGYVLAAAGPVLVGALHEMSGGWTVPLTAGLLACAAQTMVGHQAGRPRVAG